MTARESVWDYPRPPRLERTGKHLTVTAGGRVIADLDGPFKGGPGSLGW